MQQFEFLEDPGRPQAYSSVLHQAFGRTQVGGHAWPWRAIRVPVLLGGIGLDGVHGDHHPVSGGTNM